MSSESSPSLARLMALNRTVEVVLVAVLFFGLGEELWSPFMPWFLHAQHKEYARSGTLTAPIPWVVLWWVGVYACLRNLFEGFCYIRAGQLTSRLGDRG